MLSYACQNDEDYSYFIVVEDQHLKLNANLQSEMRNRSVFTGTFIHGSMCSKTQYLVCTIFICISSTQLYAMMALCLTQELPTDKT